MKSVPYIADTSALSELKGNKYQTIQYCNPKKNNKANTGKNLLNGIPRIKRNNTSDSS
jgi:hypothetical protein